MPEFFHTMRRQFTSAEWEFITAPPTDKQQLAMFYRFWVGVLSCVCMYVLCVCMYYVLCMYVLCMYYVCIMYVCIMYVCMYVVNVEILAIYLIWQFGDEQLNRQI